MTEWSVLVEHQAADTPIVDDTLFALGAELDSFSAAVTGGDGHGVSVRLTIHAPTAPAAVTSAVTIVARAAAKVGAPAADVVHVEATEWARFEADLDRRNFPDVVGASEVADLLAVSKQRLTTLSKRLDFPECAARLASGPIWTRPAIEGFLERWDRKPGRPKIRVNVTEVDHTGVVDAHVEMVDRDELEDEIADITHRPRV